MRTQQPDLTQALSKLDYVNLKQNIYWLIKPICFITCNSNNEDDTKENKDETCMKKKNRPTDFWSDSDDKGRNMTFRVRIPLIIILIIIFPPFILHKKLS
jgi:hypothetical protein